MDQWPGLQLHSHNYRGAAQFKGQNVMVVGASFSGKLLPKSSLQAAALTNTCQYVLLPK
jgi:cation diffusion facilitator CzcD-associated flavoprotein CzcO